MKSTILRTATRFLLPLLLLFALVIFLQGHNKPGGGFVGGLVAAAAFSLHALAFDARETRRMLVVDLRTLIGAGLLVALASAILPLFVGQPFFKGLWTTIEVGGNEIHLGTPLLFDLGVFLLVVGVAMLMVLTLLEPAGRRAGGSA
ncbi:MAG: Na+/H+ antiporter subunit B [Phycisphaerales bacterium]|jgi:multicomponent Na+:H+ antiporter subunit B